MDDIQYQALVSIWQVDVVPLLVGEIQFCNVQVEAQTWDLVDDLQVDGLIRLDAQDLPPKITSTHSLASEGR